MDVGFPRLEQRRVGISQYDPPYLLAHVCLLGKHPGSFWSSSPLGLFIIHSEWLTKPHVISFSEWPTESSPHRELMQVHVKDNRWKKENGDSLAWWSLEGHIPHSTAFMTFFLSLISSSIPCGSPSVQFPVALGPWNSIEQDSRRDTWNSKEINHLFWRESTFGATLAPFGWALQTGKIGACVCQVEVGIKTVWRWLSRMFHWEHSFKISAQELGFKVQDSMTIIVRPTCMGLCHFKVLSHTLSLVIIRTAPGGVEPGALSNKESQTGNLTCPKSLPKSFAATQ